MRRKGNKKSRKAVKRKSKLLIKHRPSIWITALAIGSAWLLFYMIYAVVVLHHCLTLY